MHDGRILILNDTHFGVRNDDRAFQRKQDLFNRDFFLFLNSSGIKTVLHAGDLFDRRKYINFQTLDWARKSFLDPMAKWVNETGGEFHIIPGNHDVYFRNSIDTNSLELLLQGYPFQIHMEPVELAFNEQKVLMVPWICEENLETVLNSIRDSKAFYCVAHLELEGFEMDKGNFCDHGMSAKLFERFHWVGSGHFHHRSSKGNVHYLGAAYQFTWHDFGNPKGMTVLNLNDGTHVPINNPHEIFKVYDYDDLNADSIQKDLSGDFERYRDCHVKVRIVNKKNENVFDLIMDKILDCNPIKLSIMEDETDLFENVELDDIMDVNAESTPMIINRYIESLSIKEREAPLKNLINELYAEASTMESVDE